MNNKEENKRKQEILPPQISNRLRGYVMFAVVFAVCGVVSYALSKSVFVLSLGVLTAIAVLGMMILELEKIKKTGYQVWEMSVLECTFINPNKGPTGLMLRADSGPFEGRVCHVAVSSTENVPCIGQKVDLCVPCNVDLELIKGVYYISKSYGMNLLET